MDRALGMRYQCRRSIWRLVMAAVLLAHLPATLHVFSQVWEGDSSNPAWSSLLLLSASNLFFLFEIFFASSVRLLSDRRSAVVFLLVVAILHVGVIERVLPSMVLPGDVRFWLAITAAGALAWRRLLRILAACLGAMDRRTDEQRQRLARLLFRRLLPPFTISRRVMCAWHCAPLRAPPCLPA